MTRDTRQVAAIWGFGPIQQLKGICRRPWVLLRVRELP